MAANTYQADEPVFQGIRFNIHQVELEGQRGRSVTRQMVVAPSAVVVLPLLDQQHVVLIRNERFAVGQTLWELPAGTIEPGEQPMDCAARELTEEAGYRAGKLEKLIDFYPSPGICTERMHAYMATDLQHVGQSLDDNERITVEVIPIKKSIQMIQDNTIRDGKTIATLLYYQTFLRPES